MKRKPTKCRKVSIQQRHQLLQVYLHMGQEVAAELCTEYGVGPYYARSYAQTIGLCPQRKTTGGGDIAYGVDHEDPRWARAVAVGPVCWP
jgi:hypothetical protein